MAVLMDGDIGGVFLGGTEIGEIYLGDTRIYPDDNAYGAQQWRQQQQVQQRQEET